MTPEKVSYKTTKSLLSRSPVSGRALKAQTWGIRANGDWACSKAGSTWAFVSPLLVETAARTL